MAPTNEEVVLLAAVPTEMEAAVIKSALADEGVRVVYNGETIAGFRAEAPAMVRVLVARSDYDRAQKLIATLSHEGADGEIDWKNVDVGMPEYDDE